MLLAMENGERQRMNFMLSHTPPSISDESQQGGWKENTDSQISLNLGLLSPRYQSKRIERIHCFDFQATKLPLNPPLLLETWVNLRYLYP